MDAFIAEQNKQGPLILDAAPPIRGKGLYADRPYEEGEEVTHYGGMVVPSNSKGSYIVKVSSARAIDAQHILIPGNVKGRWINENPASLRRQNVELKKRGRRFVFVAERAIRQGEQFFWYYGDEYQRDYLLAENSEIN